jgi:hypothetical protein
MINIWNEFATAIETMATSEQRTNDRLDVIVTIGRCSFALLIRKRSSATLPVGRDGGRRHRLKAGDMQQGRWRVDVVVTFVGHQHPPPW